MMAANKGRKHRNLRDDDEHITSDACPALRGRDSAALPCTPLSVPHFRFSAVAVLMHRRRSTS